MKISYSQLKEWLSILRQQIELNLNLPHVNNPNVDNPFSGFANFLVTSTMEKSWTEDRVSYKDLKTVIDSLSKTLPAYRTNTLWGKIVWWLTHPQRALHAFAGEKIGAKAYHPNHHGNFCYEHQWQLQTEGGSKTITHIIGPGPGSEENLAEKITRASNAVFQTHEGKKGAKVEEDHLEDYKGWQKKYSRNVKLLHAPVNGPLWKGENLGKMVTPQQFTQYVSKSQSEYQIPMIDQMWKQSTTWFKKKFHSKINTSMSNQACVLAFHACSALAALEEATQQHDNVLFLQTCKQGIDRGAVANAATIFLNQHQDGQNSIDTKTALFIVGLLFGRALLVDDRMIMEERLEAFSELLGALS